MRKLMLFLALGLSACGTTQPATEIVTLVRENYIVATPDGALRTCISRPARPTIRSGPDVSVLITNLDERGEDCASKLAKTWESIDDAAARAATLNQPN